MLTTTGKLRHPIKATIHGWYACLFALFLPLMPALLPGAELRPETVEAWNAYVQAVKVQMAARAQGRSPFLWVDEDCTRAQRVRAGEVLVEPLGGNLHAVPGGLIHDWIGAAFVPSVRLDDVDRVLQDYDHYNNFYKPMVAKATLIEQSPEHNKLRLLMTQRAFGITAAAETENEIDVVNVSGDREYSLSTSVRTQEIADYGAQVQRPFPEGHGPGYIWRTFSLTRLDRRGGGVYVEMETIELSRGIPLLFRWLVQPLTERLPRDILSALLQDTRDAVGQETRTARYTPPPIQH